MDRSFGAPKHRYHVYVDEDDTLVSWLLRKATPATRAASVASSAAAAVGMQIEIKVSFVLHMFDRPGCYCRTPL